MVYQDGCKKGYNIRMKEGENGRQHLKDKRGLV